MTAWNADQDRDARDLLDARGALAMTTPGFLELEADEQTQAAADLVLRCRALMAANPELLALVNSSLH